MTNPRAPGMAAFVGMNALTAAALLAPFPWPALLAVGAVAALRTGRRAFAWFAGSALAVNVALLSLLIGGEGLRVGPVGWSIEGALAGLEGGARLIAAIGANLAILSWVPPARLLDDLPMPTRVRATLAAVLIAAHDVARDFQRMRRARELAGAWPTGRFASARAAATLLPPLLVAAHARGTARREALRLAGHDLGATFAPFVAVAALCVAGRLAFLALPNVAPTYAVAFLGGIVFGGWVAAGGAALGMALTDLMLTGVHPLGFVNVPAMALLGFAGGAMRGVNLDGAAGRMFAATAGILGTFAFSVAADSATWLLLYATHPSVWLGLVATGLAFNVIPAFINGVLFAAAAPATVRAFRALQAAQPPQAGTGPPTRGVHAAAVPPQPES